MKKSTTRSYAGELPGHSKMEWVRFIVIFLGGIHTYCKEIVKVSRAKALVMFKIRLLQHCFIKRVIPFFGVGNICGLHEYESHNITKFKQGS